MGMWAVLLRNQTTGMLHAANWEANASAVQLATFYDELPLMVR
jgi:hypothetical protein